jgi:hypothetical protein
MITQTEKDTIMKLPDVNGVGGGLNGESVTIFMVRSNASTEKAIADMFISRQTGTYTIEVIGEIKFQ